MANHQLGPRRQGANENQTEGTMAAQADRAGTTPLLEEGALGAPMSSQDLVECSDSEEELEWFDNIDFLGEVREEVIKWLIERDVKRIREALGKSDILEEKDIEELLEDFRKAQKENCWISN